MSVFILELNIEADPSEYTTIITASSEKDYVEKASQLFDDLLGAHEHTPFFECYTGCEYQNIRYNASLRALVSQVEKISRVERLPDFYRGNLFDYKSLDAYSKKMVKDAFVEALLYGSRELKSELVFHHKPEVKA